MTITSLRTEFSSRLSQTTANASFSGRADDYADLLEYYCVQGIVDMRAEILANASISEEEKALVEKLTLALVNDDVTVGTKEVEEIHQMVDQLLANCDENHPYAYYYHYLKGMVVGVRGDDFALSMEHLNKSISLNANFEYAYGFRAMMNLTQDNYEAAVRDVITVIHMNKTSVAELIAQLIKDLKVQS